MAEIVIIVAVFAFVYALRSFGNGAWEEAAAENDLEFSSGFFESRSLRGRRRGFDVKISEIKKGKNRTEIVAEVRGVPAGVSLAPERGLASLILRDIETGAPDFDARVRVSGDPDLALGVLGQNVRRAVSVVVNQGGAVKDGSMRMALDRLGQIPSRLDSMLGLAELLRRESGRDLPKLLAEQALRDGSPGVRLRAFRQLLESRPRDARTRSLAEKLLGARDAELSLEAGRLLVRIPERSSTAAKRLIQIASGRHVESSTRVSALEALTGSRGRPAAVPAMAAILRAPGEPPDVREAALGGLVRARRAEELLSIRPAGDREATLLAEGLGRLDGAAQPRLLELLGHDSSRVRAAAATSLGQVGDVSAMAALHALAESGLFKSADDRAAAEAMEQIKARSGASQGGEVSVVAVKPLEGAVSRSDDDEGGEVSLTEGQDG
ncbi:MAG: HEAT repeat domain-containing protein [Acidobacteriota bacterium]